jgi:hypothetical protein
LHHFLKSWPHPKDTVLSHAWSEKIAHHFFWIPLKTEGWLAKTVAIGKRIRVGVLGGDLKEKTVSCELINSSDSSTLKSF